MQGPFSFLQLCGHSDIQLLLIRKCSWSFCEQHCYMQPTNNTLFVDIYWLPGTLLVTVNTNKSGVILDFKFLSEKETWRQKGGKVEVCTKQGADSRKGFTTQEIFEFVLKKMGVKQSLTWKLMYQKKKVADYHLINFFQEPLANLRRCCRGYRRKESEFYFFYLAICLAALVLIAACGI